MTVDCLSVGILVADHLCAPISHLPTSGELVLTDRLVLNIGGCAANAAVDLARQGISVGVVGAVGNDIFGQYLIDTLNASGVNTQSVKRVENVGTSGTLIVNVKGDDRRYIHAVGANACFTAGDIPLQLVKEAKILYVGGYLLMDALNAEELRVVFQQARKAGTITMLDVVVPGPGDHWNALETVLSETDYFMPNNDEAKAITQLDDPLAQAEKFHQAGAKNVVVTCGEQGTILLNAEQRLRASTYSVDFLDGSGAGDAFDAGFITGLLLKESPQRCLEWGSALGASCVQAIGTTTGVFNREQAEDYMQQHSIKLEQL